RSFVLSTECMGIDVLRETDNSRNRMQQFSTPALRFQQVLRRTLSLLGILLTLSLTLRVYGAQETAGQTTTNLESRLDPVLAVLVDEFRREISDLKQSNDELRR